LAHRSAGTSRQKPVFLRYPATPGNDGTIEGQGFRKLW
jgi:hypothetical protein